MYYSYTIGFIPSAWKDDGTYSEETWPADAVELTDQEEANLRAGLYLHKTIIEGPDGRPALQDPPPPTPEQLAGIAMSTRDSLLREAAIRIAPLQDAVDLDEATVEETALLKKWKQYRVALNRIQDQDGFPQSISWPQLPA